ncbi:hypothetical protein BS78_10G232000 [Paspalum vaginatum]|nr:hypothetical protein BS78_10G232000 [Paspalum vaginatum]
MLLAPSAHLPRGLAPARRAPGSPPRDLLLHQSPVAPLAVRLAATVASGSISWTSSLIPVAPSRRAPGSLFSGARLISFLFDRGSCVFPLETPFLRCHHTPRSLSILG